jgi:threonylcarbamoyladenosine tRNA methylthiotransferase MtaB
MIAEEGFREIVLSGVNIGLFGSDSSESLLDLLRQLDRVDGIDRYRISSIEPNLLSDGIIDFVAGSKSFAAHFHLPLQSGDDHVLGKMRRRYRRDRYADRVSRIKQSMPDAAVGADVIVGFPHETHESFEATASFVADLPVSYLHVFTYSERDGTKAAAEVDKGIAKPIAPSEKSRRNRVLRVLSEGKKVAFYREHLGSTRPVLWEGKKIGGRTFGFTDNYIRVSASGEDMTEGAIEIVLLDEIGMDGTVSVRTAEGRPPTLPLLRESIVN